MPTTQSQLTPEQQAEFGPHLAAFTDEVQARYDAYNDSFTGAYQPRHQLVARFGKRYVKLTIKDGGGGGSIFGYVDLTTGDVLFANGPQPAKQPRGNIFNEDNGFSALSSDYEFPTIRSLRSA